MAEIRIRPKRRSRAWLWVLLALVVAALVAWYLQANGVVVFRARTAPPAEAAPATKPGPTSAAPAPAPRLSFRS